MLRLLWVMMVVLPTAGLARDVAGQLVPPDATLPIGLEMHVQVMGPQGVAAEMRSLLADDDAPGPMAFVLTTASKDQLVLRAALYAQGVPVWVSDAVAVPAGMDGVQVGDVAVMPPILPGGLVPMVCGTAQILVGAARLVRPDGVEVALVAKAAGFSDGQVPETTFLRQGNRALLTLQGVAQPACRPVIPAALFPLHAQGDVPGWVLVADRAAMALTREDGVTAVAGAPVARITPQGLALFAAPDMNLILTRGICTDAAGRVPYPFAVTFGMPGTDLKGCAGDPMVLLAGDWTVDLVAGVAMPENDVVTMAFAGMAVAGFAGCNRYSAQITRSDAGLAFAPPVATRMACAAPMMTLEAGFLGALPRVTHVRVNANGELELRDDAALLIRAYR